MSSTDNLARLATTLNNHLAAALRGSNLLTKVRAEGRTEPSDQELAELQAADDALDTQLAAAIAARKLVE